MRRSSFRAEAPSLWVTFDASGRFAAIDGQDRTTQVVDLVTGDPVGPPIAAADAGPELGFLRDGHLVSFARHDPSTGFRVIVHDPVRGQRVGSTMPPGMEMDDQLTSDERLNITSGNEGRRPFTFPLEAEGWVDRLCRLTDRPFTPTERALLPPGVDLDRPCEG